MGGKKKTKRNDCPEITIYDKIISFRKTREGNQMNGTCIECGRVFDLLNEKDLEEVKYGHDCEVA